MEQKNPDISSLIEHYQKFGSVIFLDSQKENHGASQKSYLAAKPRCWIKSDEESIIVFEDGEERTLDGNPWTELQLFKNRQKDWLFGYLGYDLKNYTENLSSSNEKVSAIPDMYFMVPEVLIEIDSLGELTYLLGSYKGVNLEKTEGDSFSFGKQEKINKYKYLKKISLAKDQIFEGEYYEINLSHPIKYSFEGNPFELFQRMKKEGAVPFAAYLSIDDFFICSSSPERFLSRKRNIVRSQPIKGTKPSNGVSDQITRQELQNSEKERAENLMIVDLVRNDLSRFAIKGSVEVEELFEIQSFETVHQMVSTIKCEVEKATDSIDIIKSCFPMGSMTGAPKISAMKAIEELEDYRRGIYSGAIGYINPDDEFDFNVVIRTAIINQGTLIYPTGGAITSDSNPEEEWEETLLKSKALTNVI